MRKVNTLAVKAGKQFPKLINHKNQAAVPKNLPVKRSINLVTVGEKPIDVKLAVPGIVLIILAAALFGKFAVVDRLMAVSDAQQKAEVVRIQLDTGYQKIEEYGELTDEYAHYTYSGMTEEELSRVDRSDILKLLQKVVLPNSVLDSWSVQGNQMMLIIGGSRLQEINLLVQQLENEELVDFCTVETATSNTDMAISNTSASTNEVVTAQVTIYLKNALKEDE